jgi:hypothetical protein
VYAPLLVHCATSQTDIEHATTHNATWQIASVAVDDLIVARHITIVARSTMTTALWRARTPIKTHQMSSGSSPANSRPTDRSLIDYSGMSDVARTTSHHTAYGGELKSSKPLCFKCFNGTFEVSVAQRRSACEPVTLLTPGVASCKHVPLRIALALNSLKNDSSVCSFGVTSRK